MTRRYVLVTEQDGIYLGQCMGLGFWSKLDPVGQDAAATFGSMAEANEFAQTDSVCKDSPYRVVPVDADVKDEWASIESCVRAGLPAWNPAG